MLLLACLPGRQFIDWFELQREYKGIIKYMWWSRWLHGKRVRRKEKSHNNGRNICEMRQTTVLSHRGLETRRMRTAKDIFAIIFNRLSWPLRRTLTELSILFTRTRLESILSTVQLWVLLVTLNRYRPPYCICFRFQNFIVVVAWPYEKKAVQ